MTVSVSHLDVLDAERCWKLLQGHDFGRVAFRSDGWTAPGRYFG